MNKALLILLSIFVFSDALAQPAVRAERTIREHTSINDATIISGRDTTGTDIPVKGARSVTFWIFNTGTTTSHKDSIPADGLAYYTSMDGTNFVFAGNMGTSAGRHFTNSDAASTTTTFRKVSGGLTSRFWPNTGAITAFSQSATFAIEKIRVIVKTDGRRVGATTDSATVVGLTLKAIVNY